MEGLRRSELFFDPQPWPIYIAQKREEIDFVGGVKLKSDTETDRRSENSGDRKQRDNRFGLIASPSYRISWDGYKIFTLTSNQPTKVSLD